MILSTNLSILYITFFISHMRGSLSPDPEPGSKTKIPQPPGMQNMRQQSFAMQQSKTATNSLRDICKNKALFAADFDTQVKSRATHDEITYQQKTTKQTTTLAVTDNKITCQQPNDATVEVLLRILKSSIEAGNNEINITGSTKAFREKLLKELEEKAIPELPDGYKQNLTIKSPERNIVLNSGRRLGLG